jgi:hypothetical protein
MTVEPNYAEAQRVRRIVTLLERILESFEGLDLEKPDYAGAYQHIRNAIKELDA